MTTPTGQISLDDVKDEFGRAAPDGDTTGTAISLGKYRVNDDATFNKPLDVGVPQSGTIKMSDLRGRTRNVIFRYTGQNSREDVTTDNAGDTSALNVSSVYNANQNQYQGYTVSQPLRIGQFTDRPSDTTNASNPVIVTVSVAGTIGSQSTGLDNPAEQFVALDTGTLGAGASMRIEVESISSSGIGVSGNIFGAGGRGGNGSSGNGDGGNATNGTTAIGVRAGNGSVTIINKGGIIQCGFAGGGGGGGSYDDPSKSMTDPVTSGGGGGGGAGFPNGKGGDAGTNADKGDNGGAGGDSTNTTFGVGNSGGDPDEGSSGGGDGGNGGQNGTAAENGDSGSGGNQSNGSGGAAGSNGAAIRIKTGATFTLVGSVIGSTNEDGFTENG